MLRGYFLHAEVQVELVCQQDVQRDVRDFYLLQLLQTEFLAVLHLLT